MLSCLSIEHITKSTNIKSFIIPDFSLSRLSTSIAIMDRNAGHGNLCDQISNVNECQRRSSTCAIAVLFGEDKKMTNFSDRGYYFLLVIFSYDCEM